MSSASYCVSSGVELHLLVMTAVLPVTLRTSRHDHRPSSLRRTTLAGREKLDYRSRIEVEHLRACEPAVADLIEREHGAIETIAVRTDPPLPPEDDYVVVAGRDDPWVHLSLRIGGLQRDPRVAPARRLRLEPA